MCSEEWKQERNRMLHLCNEESRELTRASIEGALLQLLQEKDFQEISVTDIAKKAGVSRGAYYRNYDSKEDIFRCILRQKFQKIHDRMVKRFNEADIFAFWQGMFEGISEEKDFFMLATQIGQEFSLLESANRMAAIFIQGYNNFSYYQTLYFAGAFFNVIIGWLKSGTKESPDEMAMMMPKLGNPPENSI